MNQKFYSCLFAASMSLIVLTPQEPPIAMGGTSPSHPKWLTDIFVPSPREEVTPDTLSADLNGDGIGDQVLVRIIRHEDILEVFRKLQTHSSELNVYEVRPGALKPNSACSAGGIKMDTGGVKHLLGEEMLVIVHGGIASGDDRKRVHVLLRYRLFGKTSMRADRKPLGVGKAGDGPAVHPPRLSTTHLELLDEDGMGKAIYWDRGCYSWYPIGVY